MFFRDHPKPLLVFDFEGSSVLMLVKPTSVQINRNWINKLFPMVSHDLSLFRCIHAFKYNWETTYTLKNTKHSLLQMSYITP